MTDAAINEESGMSGQPPARVRVVLADAARAVAACADPMGEERAETDRPGRGGEDRTVDDRAAADPTSNDLTEQTGIGDALVRGLVRAQLALALRLALVMFIGLGGLPLLFAVAPAVTEVKVLGINLGWLLLGLAAYPFLGAVGWAYVHLAERNEQDFIAVVQRPER